MSETMERNNEFILARKDDGPYSVGNLSEITYDENNTYTSKDHIEQPETKHFTKPTHDTDTGTPSCAGDTPLSDSCILNRQDMQPCLIATDDEESGPRLSPPSCQRIDENVSSDVKSCIGEDSKMVKQKPEEDDGTYEELVCLVRQFYVEKPLNPAALAYQNIETC